MYLENDFQSFVNRCKKWPDNFKANKGALILLSTRSFLTPISLAMVNPQVSKMFHIQGLMLSSVMNQNYYFQLVAKSDENKFGSLCRLRQVFVTTLPSIEYLCHIWHGASVMYHEILDKVQKNNL